MVLGHIMTAIPAVNAIPAVVAAPPGIATYNDLPLPPGRKQLLMGPWYHITTGNGLGQPNTPQNVLATLYSVLGIDPATTLPDHSGRPVYLLDDRQPVAELI